MQSRITGVFLASILMAGPLLAAPAGDDELAALRVDLAQLRAEMNDLRAELHDLRALLTRVEEQVAANAPDAAAQPDVGAVLARLERKFDQVLTELRKGTTTPTKPTPRPAMTLLGQKVPAFSITTTNGDTLSDGNVAKSTAFVLNFVAPNCGFCARQIPMLETVRAEFEPLGVRFVNVNETMRQAFTPEAAAAKYDALHTKFELAIDGGNAVGRLFKATSYPTLFVIGPDGVVKHVTIGAKADIAQRVRRELEKLTR